MFISAEGTEVELTFGIEFEFIVQYHGKRRKDTTVRKWIADSLRDHGLQVNPISPEHAYDKWTVSDDRSIQLPSITVDPKPQRRSKTARESRYQKRAYTKSGIASLSARGVRYQRRETAKSESPSHRSEDSDLPDDSDELKELPTHFTAVELKTPIFHFTFDAVREIHLALEVIRVLHRLTVSTNESCGLHVHIGNEKNDFSIEILKRLAYVLLTLEKDIDGLHPSHRHNNPHAKSWSLCNHLLTGLDLPQQIGMISEKRSIREIVDVLNVGDVRKPKRLDRGWKYNFLGLLQHDQSFDDVYVGEPTMTVEFRQHEATMEVEKVMDWLQCLKDIMETAIVEGDVDVVMVREWKNAVKRGLQEGRLWDLRR